MIKTTGFRFFRISSNRTLNPGLLHMYGWLGGSFYRSGWRPMDMQWASAGRGTALYMERFRRGQLGWRSYMGRAPVRRF